MTPTRVLIYRSGAIGDTVVAIPAMRAIRAAHPGAVFLLMTAGGGEGIVWTDRVLREFGWFESVITYEASELRSVQSLWRIVERVRSSRPDVVYYLGSDKNSGMKVLRDRLFFRLAGVHHFIATHSKKVTFWGHLRREAVSYPTEVERLLAELRRGGISADTEVSFQMPITDTHIASVTQLLADARLDVSRPLVAMCPGSKQKIKVWPEERFAEIGRRLIQGGANVAIVGGADEATVGDRIAAGWPEHTAINLAQRLSILESAALLRRCSFYIGNDTGAMHLAAAVGTRCVSIFAAREPPRSWYPYGHNHVVLRKSVPCQNCYLSECVRENLRCLKDISVEEVWAACQRTMIYH